MSIFEGASGSASGTTDGLIDRLARIGAGAQEEADALAARLRGEVASNPLTATTLAGSIARDDAGTVTRGAGQIARGALDAAAGVNSNIQRSIAAAKWLAIVIAVVIVAAMIAWVAWAFFQGKLALDVIKAVPGIVPGA